LTIKGGQTTGSSTNNSGNNTNSSGNSNISAGTGQTSGIKYTVKSGDSVWKIANDHGISMNQLIEWNNIKNNFVYPGQQLIVSNGGSSSSTTTNTGNASSSSNNAGSTAASGTKYTVKSGDSVWSVSNKYGISMNQLIQWNNIKNNFIYPGQQLIVKGGSAATSTNTSSTTAATTPSTPNTSNTTSTASTGDTIYTVKAGESVWGV